MKLSMRLAKSLAQGVREGSVTTSVLDCHAQVIAELESVAQEQPEVGSSTMQEYDRVWKDWQNIKAEPGNRATAKLEARDRLARLPVFKKPM